MRILYDGAVWAGADDGGVTRYFSALVRRLPVDWEVVVTTCRRNRGPDLGAHPGLLTYSFPHHAFRPNRIARFVERWYFRSVEWRRTADLIHPTYYFSLTGRTFERRRAPIVLTVWDMIHERFPQELDPNGTFAALKQRAIRSASVVLCISETTRRDLIELYRVNEDRVVVTPLAPSIDRGMADDHEPVPPSPYVLFVGQRRGYKNFAGLLKAFAIARSRVPDLTLAAVGPPPAADERRQVSEAGLVGTVRFLGRVSDTYLARLYSQSGCLAYPSLYEGFGIPPLEAMACGTVVVAAACGSIPEVVGDAAILVDPADFHEMADALVTAVTDSTIRRRLLAAGRERLRAFSWDDLATKTVAAYESVL